MKWHDGAPFTSKDVKYTFDMVREAPEQPARLRLNPRKDWYVNVEAIEAPDPTTVVFRLKRPQPSMLSMLASGSRPSTRRTSPAAEMRNRCVGTGPFKLKEWRSRRDGRVRPQPRLLREGAARTSTACATSS